MLYFFIPCLILTLTLLVILNFKEQGLKTPYFDKFFDINIKIFRVLYKILLFISGPVSFYIFILLFEEVEKYRFFFFCTGIVGFYTIIFLIYKALKNKL